MSYRAFKRLLGETSLERKCRYLFGGFIVLLMMGSFWLYARRTEHLAYDQLVTTCRLLVNQIVPHQIATNCAPPHADDRPLTREIRIQRRSAIAGLIGVGSQNPFATASWARVVPLDSQQHERARTMSEFRQDWEGHWPASLQQYKFRFLKPNATEMENKPDDPFAHNKLREFIEDPDKIEDSQLLSKEYHYFAAIRASSSCLQCHQQLTPNLRKGDLIAVVKIRLPTDDIVSGVHMNRAVLIGTGAATAILIMFGSWVIVRYVIVKPVKHLKEVSDAISAGELNVRSEIQTGDEFEDLSHAFNRMLRNLVSMQERLRKVNADLDRKVDELAQANLALFELNQIKSDFLATMSHELRTPMNSILGFSNVLLESPGISDKQQHWVNNIKTSGDRLLTLINDILDLAKIEAGKMDVRLSNFSIYDVCEGLVTMFRPLAEKKKIDLKNRLEAGLPVLRQDPGKVQQILSNLLSNAIKFTPEGGRVTLTVEAVTSDPLSRSSPNGLSAIWGEVPTTSDALTDSPRELLLIVSDTGVGITSEEQELVFEKFRQGANPMTRDQGGSGLGLSITRELTKLLGGEVSLQSELGRGSTFTIRLPVRLSNEPRLEMTLTRESIDLSKAQRIDSRLYTPARRQDS